MSGHGIVDNAFDMIDVSPGDMMIIYMVLTKMATELNIFYALMLVRSDVATLGCCFGWLA